MGERERERERDNQVKGGERKCSLKLARKQMQREPLNGQAIKSWERETGVGVSFKNCAGGEK